MESLREELEIINKVLDGMSFWGYLSDEEKEMEIELKKRKTFLEFLAKNA